MSARGPLTNRDRAFLAKHRALAAVDQRPARGSADATEIAGDIKRETDKAWLFFDGARQEWVPKSMATRTDEGLSMPEWLAKEKGFI